MAGNQEEFIPIEWMPETLRDSAVSHKHALQSIYRESTNSNIKVDEKKRKE